MIILFDIGNTNTHVGLAGPKAVVKQVNIPTASWAKRAGEWNLKTFVGRQRITGAALCSVVPNSTPKLVEVTRRLWGLPVLQLTSKSLVGVGLNYPKPETIGPDRLANAIAVRHYFSAPAVAVDFGTAVTFDVINRRGAYVGGIIAPGLAAMTEYLHERTALLPNIKIKEVNSVIGKNTAAAMLIGAVHGYRGMVRELLAELKKKLNQRRLPVVATGGYAKLIAAKLPEITAVEPLLTLEGLRLFWHFHQRA